ncbi:MAG TPA: NmrA family NAD(P)-binding protein [Polyangiaceae bacterium]|nr:NmrA family NAD(P)-binding protein [Polyangiaceae bacterium]
MFVVLGATGNTGSVVAKTLLAAGRKVRAVVRDAAKAKELAGLGAEVHVADIADPAALGRAVTGAEGVYFLSPPDMASSDFVRERGSLTEKQVAALAAARVPHVVLLSSLGAQHPAGTGPIRTLYNVEQQLRRAGIPSTFVRAGYFVENWAAVAQPARQDGVLPSFVALDTPVTMVCTKDIGKTAAQALLDGPRAVRVIELGGPTDPTPHAVARAFSAVLGRPVQAIAAPLEAVVPTFTSFGISENIASLYREMYEGVANGLVAPEGTVVRGTTSLEETVRGLLG